MKAALPLLGVLVVNACSSTLPNVTTAPATPTSATAVMSHAERLTLLKQAVWLIDGAQDSYGGFKPVAQLQLRLPTPIEATTIMVDSAAFLATVRHTEAPHLICILARGSYGTARIPELARVLDVDLGAVCGDTRALVDDSIVRQLRHQLLRVTLGLESARYAEHAEISPPRPYEYIEAGVSELDGVTLESLPVPEGLGWAAIARSTSAPEWHCTVWVGPGGKTAAQQASGAVGSLGDPHCSNTAHIAGQQQHAAHIISAELARLLIAQEAALGRFQSYTAIPIRFEQLDYPYKLDQEGSYQLDDSVSVIRIVEATRRGWAAEGVPADVPDFVCRIRVGELSVHAEAFASVPEATPTCGPGSPTSGPPHIDPVEAMRAALWREVNVHGRTDQRVRVGDEHANGRAFVKFVEYNRLGISLRARHEAAPEITCVLWSGRVRARPATLRDRITPGSDEVACDGEITPGAPASAVAAVESMKERLRTLRSAHDVAAQTASDGVVVRILDKDEDGAFSAQAQHPGLLPGKSCVIYFEPETSAGVRTPITRAHGRMPEFPGVPACDRP